MCSSEYVRVKVNSEDDNDLTVNDNETVNMYDIVILMAYVTIN